MQLNKMSEFFSKTLFTINEQAVSVGQILLVPLIFIVGLLVARMLIGKLSQRLATKKLNADAIHLLQRVLYILTLIILVITSLDLLNVPMTAFAFISGAVAIGVGFGAQNIINNFISGWILMWERPIKIGDFLELGETRGTVEAINTRSTRIRRVDGVHLLIPNSYLLENTVVNWTLIDRKMRTSVRIGVSYGSPVEQVATLIRQAVDDQAIALNDPAPVVFFEDFGDSALIFETYFWINATADRDLRQIRSNIRFRIDTLFRENNIVIAFPQRDVHVDGVIQIANDKPL